MTCEKLGDGGEEFVCGLERVDWAVEDMVMFPRTLPCLSVHPTTVVTGARCGHICNSECRWVGVITLGGDSGDYDV